MIYDDYRRPRWWERISNYHFNPTKLIGGILFIIAWSRGDVSGLLAWAILLLFIDINFNWKR